MTLAEKAFYRLVANLISEGKILGDGAERIVAQFEAVVVELETRKPADAQTNPLTLPIPQHT